MLENLDMDGGHDLAVINISLHEARDIERAVARAMPRSIPVGRSSCRNSPFPSTRRTAGPFPAG